MAWPLGTTSSARPLPSAGMPHPWFCLAEGCECALFHLSLKRRWLCWGLINFEIPAPPPFFPTLAMGSLLEIVSVPCPLTPLVILFPLPVMLLFPLRDLSPPPNQLKLISRIPLGLSRKEGTRLLLEGLESPRRQASGHAGKGYGDSAN